MRQLTVKPADSQSGMMLLEALIAILVFSFGILGMVAINARAVQAATDSQSRADAARFASEIASLIALNVTRDTNGVSAASLQTFAHQPSGGNCAFSGAASSQAAVTQWVGSVTQAGRYGGLPGATAARLQIRVDTAATAFNRVTITMCWQLPQDTELRRHELVAYVN